MSPRVGIAALLLTTLLCLACDGQRSTDPSNTNNANSTQLTNTSATTNLSENREAFGLPFPPSFIRARRDKAMVTVYTKMSLKKLYKFFEERIVDYELFLTLNTLRIIGLRQFMPEIYAYYLNSPGGPVAIEYRAARRKPTGAQNPLAQQDTNNDSKTDNGTNGNDATRRSRKPRKGTPVRLRTPSGKLLAPGARWGEPYTPPENSPLHKTYNRSNFGKPFGEWVPH